MLPGPGRFLRGIFIVVTKNMNASMFDRKILLNIASRRINIKMEAFTETLSL